MSAPVVLVNAVGTEIVLVCTPLSLCTLRLIMLRPSSSVTLVASDMLGGLVEPILLALAVADPFIC